VATVRDRPTKRRLEIFFGRYTANPMMRGLFKIGVTPPKMALVETVGRRSGAIRRTPVTCNREGQTLWLIAQHGAHAGWVRNFQEAPHVRVRIGRHWLKGSAALVPEDDVKARIETFAGDPIGRAVMRATFRALESQPVSVRIDLDGEPTPA
jgi:deazaflavin-dependent oxidoreductase (nitroreductase family)